MNSLSELYTTIEQYAMNTQNVESFTIGDCYVNWNSLNMKYGAFNALLQYVEYQENVIALHFTMYYGEKLANDSSNVYEAQTNGFHAIRNVVRHLEENFELDGTEYLQIYPFWQKFSDVLAGAYADVIIYVPIDEMCLDYDKEEE